MKKIYLLISLLFSIFIYSQNNYQDVVYLKNGNIIYGMIIEQIPNKSIKIKQKKGKSISFTLNEIQKITKEKIQDLKKNEIQKKPKTYGIVELGFLTDKSKYSFDRISLDVTMSHSLSPNFSFGVGTGYRNYVRTSKIKSEIILIPIFLNLKYKFLNKETTPFFAIDIGKSFSVKDKETKRGGLIINPKFGVNIKTSKKITMIISLNYEIQKLSFDFPGHQPFEMSYSENITTISSKAFGLNIGATF